MLEPLSSDLLQSQKVIIVLVEEQSSNPNETTTDDDGELVNVVWTLCRKCEYIVLGQCRGAYCCQWEVLSNSTLFIRWVLVVIVGGRRRRDRHDLV